MKKFILNIYLTPKSFIAAFGIILCFILGYSFPALFFVGLVSLGILAVLVIVDFVFLYSGKVKLSAERLTSKYFSLGNDNEIKISIQNESKIAINVEIIDEIPHQLQKRDFLIKKGWAEGKEEIIKYHLTTNSRGEHHFGKLHIFVCSKLSFVQRRISFDLSKTIACYPSIIDMKKYQLLIDGRMNALKGIRKIRKIGQSSEFEQIKDYVSGDDYNKINWKSTGRQNKLMVNHFTDEKSQLIYCFIDKSKSMAMPFSGLSLLDYAINASLMIANTSILKKDNIGLVSFAKNVENVVKAGSKSGQLRLILNSLYKEEERDTDADYEQLYQTSKRVLKKRSLIFLFTNFESKYALDRALPILKNLSKAHLLVPIIFKNEELETFYKSKATSIHDIYLTTIAQKFATEKQLIVHELQAHGIQTIFTAPEKLSANVLNKYLELKARGMI